MTNLIANAIVIGWLSAYAQIPTDATLAYRLSTGDIYASQLQHTDGVIAVLDCSRIGQHAVMRTEHGLFDLLVFDCAGKPPGGSQWMIENNIAGEVGWYLWERHPEIVGSRVSLEFYSKEVDK